MKNTILAGSIASLFLFSCGGSTTKDQNTAANTKEAAADKATIKDDQLYPFMLGGVYFFHGYGGGKEALDKLIKGGMQSKPGDAGFLDELHTVYTSYFIYPFKPEDGGAKEILAEYWDINDKASFEKSQDELLTSGSQSEYSTLNATGAVAKTPDEKTRLAFIQAHKTEFPKAGVKAWDIARYVNNTALGYAAGYLTKAEGNAALAKLPALVKSQFSSWEEYWKSFNLGRKLWAGDEEHDAEFDNTSKEMQQGDYSMYKYMKL